MLRISNLLRLATGVSETVTNPLYKRAGIISCISQSVPSREFHLCQSQLAKFKELQVELPKPGPGNGYYRRVVHYPEKYTLKPVRYTNLAGRDPKSGRVIVGTLGGGIKHPLLWVDYVRKVPENME